MGSIAVVAAALLLVGGISYKSHTEQQEADRVAAAAAAAAAAKQQEADEALAAQQASDEAERTLREITVKSVQKSITKMAREHAADGLLTGPVLRTSCTPVAGGSISDLTEETTKFSCLAVTEKLSGSRMRGYNYHAVVNWEDGTYTYGYGE